GRAAVPARVAAARGARAARAARARARDAAGRAARKGQLRGRSPALDSVAAPGLFRTARRAEAGRRAARAAPARAQSARGAGHDRSRGLLAAALPGAAPAADAPLPAARVARRSVNCAPTSGAQVSKFATDSLLAGIPHAGARCALYALIAFAC